MQAALYILLGMVLGIAGSAGLVIYSAYVDWKENKKDNTEMGRKYQSSIKKYKP